MQAGQFVEDTDTAHDKNRVALSLNSAFKPISNGNKNSVEQEPV